MIAPLRSPSGSRSGTSWEFPRHAEGRLTLAAVGAPGSSSEQVFSEYFKLPGDLASSRKRPVALSSERAATLSAQSEPGYFRFGEAVCYGRRSGGPVAQSASEPLPDATSSDDGSDGTLPFDLAEVVRNLRLERYPHQDADEGVTSDKAARRIYYFLRPILAVAVRKHLQKIRFQGWERIAFPHWPVDVSVDRLMRGAMARVLQSGGVDRVPFIWFWPDGAPSCLVVTHDVEGSRGRGFCRELMDLDDAFGMKSSFQIVPEAPRQSFDQTMALIDTIRSRGFEVNLHDLNHDGQLFQDRAEFLERSARINEHARALGCRGFRSGAMYREQDWYEAFDFSFDMSVPNVAHLEPQRGGCCTVLPYFVGKVLELPLTTIQDYSLFHILGDYSIDLWKEQIDRIRFEHGLITVLGHPDYLYPRRARAVYTELLRHLCALRESGAVWMALPTAVDEWWRNRQRMSLVPDGSSWRVVGPGSERARVAFATLDRGTVTYTVSAHS
jgi:hypothetical protein